MTQIVNLTGHPVNIYRNDIMGSANPEFITSYPSAGCVRVHQKTLTRERVMDQSGNIIPITTNVYTEPLLPPQEPGKLYIVSLIVANLFRDRDDLVIPNGFIHLDKTKVGCISLAKL